MANAVESPTSLCRFGLAVRDITPPVGIYHRMWGAATHDRAEGVHRPLTATAIVFAPASASFEQQVLVTMDHCLLMPPELGRLTDRICSDCGVSPDQLLITFSHTHAAGLMDTSRADIPGGELIEPYLEDVADEISAAIRHAMDDMQLVVITYVTGRCDLAAHRDYWDSSSGNYVCGFNPDAEADDTLLVARVTSDASGQLVATIVNYACHPTTLAWENRLISPDFVGAMRETIEQATGAPSVFLQGASGDLGPRQGYVGDTRVADQNGRQVGYAALAVLENALPPLTRFCYAGPVLSGATLGTWRNESLGDAPLAQKRIWGLERSTTPLSYREELQNIDETRKQFDHWQREEQQARGSGDGVAANDARAMAERSRRLLARLVSLPLGDFFPFPICIWRIGDALWLAVEGEPYSLLQTALRERFPSTPMIIMGLGGGWRPGYLPTRETYGKGIYQESIAVLAAGCLERLIDVLTERVETLLSPSDSG